MPKETDFKIVIKKPADTKSQNSTATQTQQKPKQ